MFVINNTKAKIAVAFFAASAPVTPPKLYVATIAGIERATPANEQDPTEA